jgi:formate dehydrogenase maturation protein FdhE
MLDAAPMPSPEPELPETRERGSCPVCQSERIAPVGRVMASDGVIKVQHRCDACETAFWFVRKPII